MLHMAHDYGYSHGLCTWDDRAVFRVVQSVLAELPAGSRVFDLGCGNGAVAARMAALGLDVTAVDPSPSGIEAARSHHRGPAFHVGSVEEDLAGTYGQFAAVVSLEVIEHCYSPLRFATAVRELVAPGGLAIVSTPYHGYLKNLALALSNRLDAHFTALWEGGHIKFFSVKTLTELFATQGFGDVRIRRTGRVAPLAKSMVLVARRA